ncbi:MAG: hypothetical protein ACYTF9_11185, partial [Planctomycetota bacterium]
MTRMTSVRRLFALPFLFLLFAAGGTLHAFPQAADDENFTLESVTIDAAAVQARVNELRETSERTEDQNSELELLNAALASLVKAREAADQRAAFESEVAGANERIDAIDELLATRPPPPPVDLRLDLPEIAAQLLAARSVLDADRRKVQSAEADLSAAIERGGSLNDDIAAATARRGELVRLLSESPSGDTAAEVVDARRTRLHAERIEVAERLSRLEVEAATAEARRRLLRAERDEARYRVEVSELIVDRLLARSNELQLSEAGKQRKRASELRGRAALPRTHPLVADVLKSAAELHDELAVAIELRAELDTQSKIATDQVAAYEAEFTQIQTQVEMVGLTTLIGQRLRAEAAKLTSPGDINRQIRRRRSGYEQKQNRWLKLEGRPGSRTEEADRRMAAHDPPIVRPDLPLTGVRISEKRQRIIEADPSLTREQVTDALATFFSIELARSLSDRRDSIAERDPSLTQLQITETLSTELEPDVRTLLLHARIWDALTTRNAVRGELVEVYDRIFNTSLPTLDRSELRLRDVSRTYGDYIAERVLWIRSANPVSIGDFAVGITAIRNAITERRWRDLLGALSTSIAQARVIAITGLLLLAGVILVRSRARRRIEELSSRVQRPETDAFAHTLEVLALTVLRALPLALCLAIFGWLLILAEDAAATATGFAIVHGALLLFSIDFVRASARPNGLGPAHFKWRPDASKAILAGLNWYRSLLIPIFIAVVLVRGAESIPDESIADPMATAAEAATLTTTVGRLCAVLFMVATFMLAQRLLRFNGPIVGPILQRHEGGWLERLRFVWYPALLLIPTSLLIAILLGYQYTAQILTRELLFTGQIVIIGAYVDGLLLRWLVVAQQRMAIEKRRRRREKAMAAATTR